VTRVMVLVLGALFESLACQSVRVFAETAGAAVSHFRTKGGEREVDFIVETTNRRVVALEAKLSAAIGRDDTANLRWLAARLGDRFAGGVVLSTGREAYRDQDGIAVVPLALLGP
jgi:predicted AAA+ superfamily ATPase